jgi:ABC-type multidrug transport system fused ATPase/permease subunit
MKLIDLYVSEVGKRLPLRERSDIEAELRSTLQDMLEDRSQKAGRPADEAMERDLLAEYGSPDKVAATYHPTNYLIGPRLYPFFVMVLRIVLTVLIVVLLVGLGIQLASGPFTGQALAQAMAKGLAGILGAALQAFGNIALVFAILERVLPASEFKFDEEKKQWDPASLIKEERKTEVGLWQPILAIIVTAAAMVLFNGYPQVIGPFFLRSGQWISIPVLTGAFFKVLPYINIVWALEIAFNLVLLRQGRWQPVTKWTEIALNLAGAIICYVLLMGPPIVGISPAALQAAGIAEASAAATLSTLIGQAARAVVAIVMIVKLVDVIKGTIKQARGR